MHVWTTKCSWYLQCKTTKTFSAWWKSQTARAVSPALMAGFKVPGEHAPATQITRKDLAKPPFRGSHASFGQCWGGERLTGTPEAICDRIKERLGSNDYWESAVILQGRPQSVPSPYLDTAGYRITGSAGEGKKWGHKAQIIIQSKKKECQQQIPKSNEKIFVVWGWQDACPAQHTLFREEPRAEG